MSLRTGNLGWLIDGLSCYELVILWNISEAKPLLTLPQIIPNLVKFSTWYNPI